MSFDYPEKKGTVPQEEMFGPLFQVINICYMGTVQAKKKHSEVGTVNMFEEEIGIVMEEVSVIGK